MRKRISVNQDAVQQLIKHYTKEELQELVLHLAGSSETAWQGLLDFCQGKEKGVESDNLSLIIEKQLGLHWSKAKKIIAKFDRYGGGPEREEEIACEELDKMTKLLKDHKVSWTARKQVLDELLVFVASDNSGFTDCLADVAFALCETREENIYLADFLARKGSSYYQETAAAIYRECGENAKFLEYQKAHMECGEDYVRLADYYIQHGDEKQALKLLWEGARKSNGGSADIDRYMFDYFKAKEDGKSLEKLYEISQKRSRGQGVILELMHQYYREKREYGRQKEMILKLFSHVDGNSLYELYGDCKKELTAADFAAEEKNILKVIRERKLTVYFEILMDKKETGEVLAYITQHPDYEEWNAVDEYHRFSKRLTGQYPREIVELYWNEVDEFVGRKNVKYYGHVAAVLKEIRDIMRNNKWDEEWERRYGEFLRANEKKRALMREVERI